MKTRPAVALSTEGVRNCFMKSTYDFVAAKQLRVVSQVMEIYSWRIATWVVKTHVGIGRVSRGG